MPFGDFRSYKMNLSCRNGIRTLWRPIGIRKPKKRARVIRRWLLASVLWRMFHQPNQKRRNGHHESAKRRKRMSKRHLWIRRHPKPEKLQLLSRQQQKTTPMTLNQHLLLHRQLQTESRQKRQSQQHPRSLLLLLLLHHHPNQPRHPNRRYGNL